MKRIVTTDANLKALDESIIHWRENAKAVRAGEDFCIYSKACALCQLHKVWSSGCGDCPIAKDGFDGCEGDEDEEISPWGQVGDAHERFTYEQAKRPGNESVQRLQLNLVMAVDNQLDYLIDLRKRCVVDDDA